MDLFAEAFQKLFAAIADELTQPAAGCTFPACGPAAGDRDRGSRHDRGLAVRGQGAAPVGRRPHAVDGRGRVGLARLARTSPRTSSRTPERLDRIARDVAEAGFEHVAAARHGRLEPLPGAALADVPARRGPSGAAHPRLDRPGAGERARARARPRPHRLHRLQQVRHDARAEHLRAVLLRAHARARSAPRRPRDASSRSPTPARSSSSWPRRRAFATSRTASRRSAGATPPCRTSACCRAP